MAGPTSSSRNWDPRKMYDVSEAEQAAMKERAAIRAGMRKEWQMKSTSPHRGVTGFIFDPAVQRYNSMRANHWDTFKATPKSAAFGLFFGVAPILFLWYKLETGKNEREKLFRAGKVSYRDRDWKFI